MVSQVWTKRATGEQTEHGRQKLGKAGSRQGRTGNSSNINNNVTSRRENKTGTAGGAGKTTKRANRQADKNICNSAAQRLLLRSAEDGYDWWHGSASHLHSPELKQQAVCALPAPADHDERDGYNDVSGVWLVACSLFSLATIVSFSSLMLSQEGQKKDICWWDRHGIFSPAHLSWPCTRAQPSFLSPLTALSHLFLFDWDFLLHIHVYCIVEMDRLGAAA